MPNLSLFRAGLSGDVLEFDTPETTIQAVDVKAEVFRPNVPFMQDALKHKAIVEYARNGFFSNNPLFVIVGVVTATELSIQEKQGSEHEVAGSADLVAPDGAGEPEASLGHDEPIGNVESETKVTGTSAFAYRLRQFAYGPILGLRDKSNYADSLYNYEGPEDKPADTTQKPVDEFPEFLYLRGEDVAASDLASFSV